jgi:DNA-binding response OmpR family regulator
LSGFDVLNSVKGKTLFSGIPVIILTASDSETGKLKALDGHANSYITTPADYAGFTKMVENLANDWLN